MNVCSVWLDKIISVRRHDDFASTAVAAEDDHEEEPAEKEEEEEEECRFLSGFPRRRRRRLWALLSLLRRCFVSSCLPPFDLLNLRLNSRVRRTRAFRAN